MHNRKAFTITELFVLFAMLVIFSALLYPALMRVNAVTASVTNFTCSKTFERARHESNADLFGVFEKDGQILILECPIDIYAVLKINTKYNLLYKAINWDGINGYLSKAEEVKTAEKEEPK
jgi:hypothetical protein